MYFDSPQRISAVSGMALVILTYPESQEVLKTIILAGIGGVSSYLFTLAVKILLIRLRQKFK